MDLIKFRRSLGGGTDDEIVRGCADIDPTIKTPEQGKIFIWSMFKRLLETDRYASAGTLLWGEELFNCGPAMVRKILNFARTHQNIIVLGAAACGKTYGLVSFCLLESFPVSCANSVDLS